MPLFRPFGPDHWAAMALTAVAAGALLGNARRLRRLPNDRWIRAGLAIVIVGNELISWISSGLQGIWRLPLQLCDLAMVVMGWALVGRQTFVSAVAFYWGLGGSLQAVLTPDLSQAFPHAQWVVFFLGHGGMVVSAVYLAVRGMVPLDRATVWRVWLLTNGYAAVAGAVNWGLGTNYGYLAHKPAHPSLLDVLGPWPYYILAVEGVAVVLFFLCLAAACAIERRASPAARAAWH